MNIKGKVVFSSGKTGDYDIWTLDLVNKEIKQLTTGPYWNDCPKWSPDGKRVVFISNRTGTPEIWIMNEDGTNQNRITSTDRWHNTPDWSPDGQQLVFCANYQGNIDVFTMNVDGTDLKQITNYEGMDFTPQFSPDAKRIIFTSQRSGNDDIWTVDLQTKEFNQLTDYKEKDFSPTYSPDFKFIAFVCGELTATGEENLEIYLMNQDGKNRKRITHNLGADRYVAWSADGKSLIYTSSKSKSAVERLMVIDVEKLKTDQIDFDRKPLEDEIDAQPRGIGLFSLLPENVIRKFYPESYFGTERYPDWKF